MQCTLHGLPIPRSLPACCNIFFTTTTQLPSHVSTFPISTHFLANLIIALKYDYRIPFIETCMEILRFLRVKAC